MYKYLNIFIFYLFENFAFSITSPQTKNTSESLMAQLHLIFNQSNWKSWTFLLKLTLENRQVFFFLVWNKKEDENLFDRNLWWEDIFFSRNNLVLCHNVIKRNGRKPLETKVKIIRQFIYFDKVVNETGEKYKMMETEFSSKFLLYMHERKIDGYVFANLPSSLYVNVHIYIFTKPLSIYVTYVYCMK